MSIIFYYLLDLFTTSMITAAITMTTIDLIGAN